MTYQQPPDDPKMRSEIDDLYEALFKSLGESTNRVDVVINVLLRMICAIAVEHGADKDTVMGATEACFDATLAAKALHDKYESTLQ
tara:strand:+ start:230 stop:487 length:258 start_codon:yes stop_codon:yes gene_type:complete